MKKILLGIMMFAGVCACQAAKKVSPIANVDVVNFYGIDYSKCQTIGVDENSENIKKALVGVNNLFVSEGKKYDVERFTKKKLGKLAVRVGVDLTQNMNVDSLNALDANRKVSEEEIANTVKELKLNETNGTGLILIGESLNKAKEMGTYYIVFFDIASRNIVAKWQESVKAGGFGLRNYWAKSVFLTMDAIKNKKQ